MKISNEVKVGIAVVITIAGLIWGLNYLKGTDLFATTNKYFVVYNNVNGIVKSNPVIMNGYKIGQVDKIEYTKDKSGRLVVTLKIDDNIFVPKSSNAVIVSSDLLGSKAIENDYSMKGRTDYRIQIKEDSKIKNTYQLSSVRSQTAKYLHENSKIPGKANEIVIDVPKGSHTYQISLLDKNKCSLLCRILFPKKDIKNEFKE